MSVAVNFVRAMAKQLVGPLNTLLNPYQTTSKKRQRTGSKCRNLDIGSNSFKVGAEHEVRPCILRNLNILALLIRDGVGFEDYVRGRYVTESADRTPDI